MMHEIYSCGQDLGTMFLQSARDDGNGKVVYNTVRDCYRVIEYDEDFEDTLKIQGARYVRDEKKIYVLGNDAYLQAGMAEFGAGQAGSSVDILQRPMKDGILNPDSPKMAMTILRELMKLCLEKGVGPAREGEVLYFSVPADPMDSAINNKFHRMMAQRYLNSLGYDASPLSEGLSVIYAENPKMYTPDGEIPFTGIGISCLLPGTKIYCQRGIVNIEHIREDDIVLTHKGRWRPVRKVIAKSYSGIYTKLKIQGYAGNPDLYRFVDNHEVLVNKDGNWSWIGCEQLVEGDIVGEPIEKRNRTESQPYMCLYERRSCSKQIFKKTFVASGDIQRLIGYFLGDGSCDLGSIQFDFSNSEKDNIKDVQEILKNTFGKNSTLLTRGEGHTRVACYSLSLSKWFKSKCYDEDGNKRYPFKVSSLNTTNCINLLAGLIRSDGADSENQITFDNTSTNLVLLAKQLFSKLGMPASITFREPRKHEIIDHGSTSSISGRKQSWTISTEATIPIKGLLTAIRDISNHSRFPDKIFIEDGFCCGKIQSVENEEYIGTVYDLQVEEDHSFSGPFLTIHNCGAGQTNFCLAERGLPLDEFSCAKAGDWVDANAARMVGQPKTKIIRVKERNLNFAQIDQNDEVLLALECYYEELINYVFGVFRDRFESNKGNIDYPIEIILSGGTASPPGFGTKVERMLAKMDLPFEIKQVRMAKDMLRTVAKGCYIRARQAAKKKAAAKRDFDEAAN